MAIRVLLTIGYEGSNLEHFLSTLEDFGVTTVLDVRELPLSRKKGFSKTPLSAALGDLGIEYRHERRLGCPPEIRERLKRTGDYTRYFRDFNSYLSRNLDVVRDIAGHLDGVVALLCYERNAQLCHRSSVAERMRQFCTTAPRHVAVPA